MNIKNYEKKDQDYIEYKRKSPAQIILMIQRNLFALQMNPVIFFIINFILISYLYDKQYVQFQAITWNSILLFSDFSNDYCCMPKGVSKELLA